MADVHSCVLGLQSHRPVITVAVWQKTHSENSGSAHVWGQCIFIHKQFKATVSSRKPIFSYAIALVASEEPTTCLSVDILNIIS